MVCGTSLYFPPFSNPSSLDAKPVKFAAVKVFLSPDGNIVVCAWTQFEYCLFTAAMPVVLPLERLL